MGTPFEYFSGGLKGYIPTGVFIQALCRQLLERFRSAVDCSRTRRTTGCSQVPHRQGELQCMNAVLREKKCTFW